MIAFVRRSYGVGKKIFFAIFILTLFLLTIPLFFQPSKELATKSDSFETERVAAYKKIFHDPQFAKDKQKAYWTKLVTTFSCYMVGELCSPDPSLARDNFVKKSMVGQITSYISLPLANPPASGVYWAYDSMQNVGFLPNTYAAEGVGFAGIKPLVEIWKIFRNVTFLLLSLLLIVIGILIMIRFKINPQTIITLENSLPRIFITLIFITFSFPIAGFLIDLMYTSILIGVGIFHQAAPSVFDNIPELQRNFTAGTMGTIWDSLMPRTHHTWINSIPVFGKLVSLFDLGTALLDVLPSFVNDSIRTLSSFYVVKTIWPWLFASDSGFLANIAKMINDPEVLTFSPGGLLSGTVLLGLKVLSLALLLPLLWVYGGGLLIGLLILLTLVSLLIRIFVLVFATYVRILIYIIFAPFLILPTVLPGKNGFTHWFRILLGEISVFPTMVFMFLTGKLLVNVFSGDSNSPGLWHPPFLSAIGKKQLSILVGMALIFSIPDIVRSIRQKISGTKGPAQSFGPGLFFGGITGGAAAGFGTIAKYGSFSHGIAGLQRSEFLKKLPGVGKILGGGGGGGNPTGH